MSGTYARTRAWPFSAYIKWAMTAFAILFLAWLLVQPPTVQTSHGQERTVVTTTTEVHDIVTTQYQTVTRFETIRVTITSYVSTTTTLTPEDVRIFTKYVYVFVFLLIVAPIAVWQIGRAKKQVQALPPGPQVRFCIKCGRNLTNFPSTIRVCPYCGTELK